MNELTNVVVTYELPKINYDLKEVKEQVKIISSKYQDLVICEDDIPTMKKDIATLNKLSKAIDTKRKDVVREIKSPLTEFETELKSLVSDLNGAYRSVKDQIDTFTEQQKELRKNEIMSWEEWEDYYEFEERWLGKSVKDNAIKSDLQHLKSIYDNNITMIKTTCKMVDLAEGKYIDMLKKHVNINEIVAFIQNDKEVIELNKKQDDDITLAFENIEKETQEIEIEKVYTTEILTISCEVEQMKDLKKYMIENGIEFYN